MRRWVLQGSMKAALRRQFASLGASKVSIQLAGAPITHALQEGYGVVTSVGSKVSSLKESDVVFVNKLSEKDFADFSKDVVVDSSTASKIPESTDPSVASCFTSACAAYKLLEDVKENEVVVHYGAETAIGQFLAQFSRKRNFKLISLVSSDTVEFDETVDLLKSLGSFMAAPADYCIWPGYRKICDELGNPTRVIVDSTHLDTPKVNLLLEGAAKGFKASRKAVEKAEKIDLRDAKILNTMLSCASKPLASFVSYDAAKVHKGTITGATPFSLPDVLNDEHIVNAVSDIVKDKKELIVFAEAYDEGAYVFFVLFFCFHFFFLLRSFERAIMRRDGGVYGHPFRSQLFLRGAKERWEV